MHIFRGQDKGFTIVELLIVIVVIGILAAITVVAYTGITNQARISTQNSDLTQWKKQASVYRVQNGFENCPANYAFVYGNATLGTADFCVMKYEAKIQGNDVGTTTYSASMVADSRPTGSPWVNISQTQAITEASDACSGCRLITEAEWMTIVADVLSVKYNWSGGAVGSGYIYSGHNDNSPANSLAAAADDADGYSGTGNSVGQTSITNGVAGDAQKRTLYLKSGDVIWDVAGNTWEWTAQSQAVSNIGVSGDSGYSYRQWNLGTLSMGNLPTVTRPGTIATITGLSGATSWSSAQGIGQINANYADTSTRASLHSGGWSNGVNAGVMTLNLANGPATSSSNIGFRVAR